MEAKIYRVLAASIIISVAIYLQILYPFNIIGSTVINDVINEGGSTPILMLSPYPESLDRILEA